MLKGVLVLATGLAGAQALCIVPSFPPDQRCTICPPDLLRNEGSACAIGFELQPCFPSTEACCEASDRIGNRPYCRQYPPLEVPGTCATVVSRSPFQTNAQCKFWCDRWRTLGDLVNPLLVWNFQARCSLEAPDGCFSEWVHGRLARSGVLTQSAAECQTLCQAHRLCERFVWDRGSHDCSFETRGELLAVVTQPLSVATNITHVCATETGAFCREDPSRCLSCYGTHVCIWRSADIVTGPKFCGSRTDLCHPFSGGGPWYEPLDRPFYSRYLLPVASPTSAHGLLMGETAPILNLNSPTALKSPAAVDPPTAPERELDEVDEGEDVSENEVDDEFESDVIDTLLRRAGGRSVLGREVEDNFPLPRVPSSRLVHVTHDRFLRGEGDLMGASKSAISSSDFSSSIIL